MGFILRKTITETFLERVRSTPQASGFMTRERDGWKRRSFQDFASDAERVALGLLAVGALPGDRIALLSGTRYEWSVCDMAILGARAVTVPIYPSNTAADAQQILNHSEARILILEDAAQLTKILELRRAKPDAFPFLQRIIAIDGGAMSVVGRNLDLAKDVLTLQALQELGRRLETQDPGRIRKNWAAAQPSDVITIGYTSGTTGVPKGVVLTHDNLMCVLEDCVTAFANHITPDAETILSFLPFSHIIGKVESLAIHVFGWEQAFAESIEALPRDLREIKPTILFAVPRIFEKAYERIQARLAPPARGGSALSRLVTGLAQTALKAGDNIHSALRSQRAPAPWDIARRAIARRTLFTPVREAFGGKLRFAICGGAPLNPTIGEFFHTVGVEVLEGYGLTETCAPVALNTPDLLRFGSVGRPLPETQVQIAEDGEILLKSRKVFREYYKMPAETAEVLHDGWFHTGDVGHIDDQGYLFITDRKKDLLITSGGKNIAPQKIEKLAAGVPLFSHFVVVGDAKNYLCALITLDPTRLELFARERELISSGSDALLRHPLVMTHVQEQIDAMNRELASFETIKKFLLIPGAFTVEGGELTPSLKIRRPVIARKYAAEIERMYAG